MNLFEIEEGGEIRRLGTLPATTSRPIELNQEFGSVGAATLIPRSQWKPVSFRSLFPRIKDQDGVGMCNCSATGNVVEGCRRMVGGVADVDLSAGDLYHRISGGTDRGSLPEEALKEMMLRGMAPVSAVQYLDWRGSHPSVVNDRLKYRITEALWCPTFDHVASALQQGFLVDLGVWWYGRDPLNADGWLFNPSGSRGGHAVCACELAEKNGNWGIGIVNSWTASWGQSGFGILPESRVSEGCQVFQAWACRGVIQESGTFPAPQE